MSDALRNVLETADQAKMLREELMNEVYESVKSVVGKKVLDAIPFGGIVKLAFGAASAYKKAKEKVRVRIAENERRIEENSLRDRITKLKSGFTRGASIVLRVHARDYDAKAEDVRTDIDAFVKEVLGEDSGSPDAKLALELFEEQAALQRLIGELDGGEARMEELGKLAQSQSDQNAVPSGEILDRMKVINRAEENSPFIAEARVADAGTNADSEPKAERKESVLIAQNPEAALALMQATEPFDPAVTAKQIIAARFRVTGLHLSRNIHARLALANVPDLTWVDVDGEGNMSPVDLREDVRQRLAAATPEELAGKSYRDVLNEMYPPALRFPAENTQNQAYIAVAQEIARNPVFTDITLDAASIKNLRAILEAKFPQTQEMQNAIQGALNILAGLVVRTFCPPEKNLMNTTIKAVLAELQV